MHPKAIIAGFLTSAVLSSAYSFGALIVWPVSQGGNNHTYELVIDPNLITWPDAEAAAQAKGGYLVTITSAAENQFVFDNLVNNPAAWRDNFLPPFQNQAAGPWIGAFQPPGSVEPAGGWQWVHGEGLLSNGYTNWESFAPDNFGVQQDAALFYDANLDDPPKINNGWNDWEHANHSGSYIIEYDRPVPEPSTGWFGVVGLAALLAYGLKKGRR